MPSMPIMALFALTLAAAGPAGAAGAADAPERGFQGGASGLWLTSHDHGVVEVAPCGQALCGRVITSDHLKAHPEQTDERNADKSLRSRPVKGLSIFYGVTGGPPVWSGGKVYNPTDGHTYQGSITLIDADTLKLTGCVFYPLCRSETWTRMR